MPCCLFVPVTMLRRLIISILRSPSVPKIRATIFGSRRLTPASALMTSRGLSEIPLTVLDMGSSPCWPYMLNSAYTDPDHDPTTALFCQAWVEYYYHDDPQAALAVLDESIALHPTYGPYAFRAEVNAVL